VRTDVHLSNVYLNHIAVNGPDTSSRSPVLPAGRSTIMVCRLAVDHELSLQVDHVIRLVLTYDRVNVHLER
jgi:hypothetical protein